MNTPQHCPACAEKDTRIATLETYIRNVTTMRDDERTCGELSAEECTGRYMAQRERIAALEGQLARVVKAGLSLESGIDDYWATTRPGQAILTKWKSAIDLAAVRGKL